MWSIKLYITKKDGIQKQSNYVLILFLLIIPVYVCFNEPIYFDTIKKFFQKVRS